mgnify:CR=1 FL=1
MYITDQHSRHEITSWRLNDAPDVPPAVGGGGGACGTAHVIVVVDHSGSMRKDDVPGYGSRTAAVYDCLARDLVEPQLRVAGGSRMEVRECGVWGGRTQSFVCARTTGRAGACTISLKPWPHAFAPSG